MRRVRHVTAMQVDHGARDLRELAAHPNIGGIKESSGDVAVVGEHVARVPAEFPVVVGAAPSLYASLMVGACVNVDGGQSRSLI